MFHFQSHSTRRQSLEGQCLIVDSTTQWKASPNQATHHRVCFQLYRKQGVSLYATELPVQQFSQTVTPPKNTHKDIPFPPPSTQKIANKATNGSLSREGVRHKRKLECTTNGVPKCTPSRVQKKRLHFATVLKRF